MLILCSFAQKCFVVISRIINIHFCTKKEKGELKPQKPSNNIREMSQESVNNDNTPSSLLHNEINNPSDACSENEEIIPDDVEFTQLRSDVNIETDSTEKQNRDIDSIIHSNTIKNVESNIFSLSNYSINNNSSANTADVRKSCINQKATNPYKNLKKGYNSNPSSISEALHAMLLSTDHCDVHLQSTTNFDPSNSSESIVPASRFVLASRSPVFSSMLFGEFKEANNMVVKLDWDVDTLKAVVEYCHTDEILGLTTSKSGLSSNSHKGDLKHISFVDTPESQYQNPIQSPIQENSPQRSIQTEDDSQSIFVSPKHGSTLNRNSLTAPSLSRIRTIIRIANAAHYFQLPHLVTKLEAVMHQKLNDHPKLCCVALDESLGTSMEESYITHLSAEMIKKNTVDILLASGLFGGCRDYPKIAGVDCLGERAMEWVVSNQQLEACEVSIFKIILRWAASMGSEDKNDNENSCCTVGRKYLDFNTKDIPKDVSKSPNSGRREKDQSVQNLPVHNTIQNSTRVEKAQYFIKRYVELSRISPSDLEALVEPSSLTDNQQLFKAYRSQALVLNSCHEEFRKLLRIPRSIFSGGLFVSVQGAGISQVNGNYSFRAVQKGYPIYSKECRLNGRKEMVTIARTRTKTTWYLCIVHDSTMMDLDPQDMRFFYKAESAVEESDINSNINCKINTNCVPKRGWTSLGGDGVPQYVGIDPAPVISCNVDRAI